MGAHVTSALERAQREGAQLLLIEMDTPGGLVSTTQDLVQAILTAEIPVVVFVSPSGAHAASAGTFITLAAHVAAMAPATRIGAAHPVTGAGKDPEESGGRHMARKIENDLLAMVEGIAKERNRNVEWAKDAVRDSVSADAAKAAEIGVVDLVADDRDALLAALDGREIELNGRRVAFSLSAPEIRTYEPSMRNELLNLMASPGIAALLGLLGLIGILIEFYNPGLIVPAPSASSRSSAL
jgi:membrane-bound serine protease (ClpP class)